MLRTFYQVTDLELSHTTNEVEDKIYTLNLFFKNLEDYKECLKELHNIFKFQAIGKVFLSQNSAYQVSVLDLTRVDTDMIHGFVSYESNSNLVRVYWNNKQKKILFYTE